MKKMFLFSICSLLLCGCADQSDRYSVDIPASGDTPLSVSSVSLSGSIETKAIQKSGSIGVFRTAAGGYTALNNVKYTYSSDWIPASPIYLNSTAASVCGYYPYGAAGITNSSNPSSVTLTSQKYSEGEDLCYSTLVNNPTSSNPQVSFSMVRAYARLTINITRENAYTGTCAISNISIVNPGIKTSNTFNITTGAYGSGTTGTVSYNPGISSIASGSSTTTSVLMVPTTMTGYMYLNFTVDGTERTAFLPVATNNLSTLAAGGNYNINITIGLKGQPESNCYIVAPGGTVIIPVSRANTANPAGFSITDDFTTGLLWSDVSGTHVTPTVSGRYIKVVAGASPGNSVIYAKDTNGNIVWSWHIWVTDYNPSASTFTYNTRIWLDRNIGATSSGTTSAAYGLLYQWGRKDPFVGSGVITYGTSPTFENAGPVTLATSIAIPNKFYYATSNPNDWCNVRNQYFWITETTNAKTIYDPCPLGWCVPPASYFSGSFGTNNIAFSGYCDYEADFSGKGSGAYWWTSTAVTPSSGDAYAQSIHENGVMYKGNRASAMAIRCVKDI